MGVLLALLSVCYVNIVSSEAADSAELELQRVISHYMVAGKRTQVLLESKKCS